MVPGEQNIAAVFDLRPATSYHFRIVARNEIGDSTPSDTVTITTAEECEYNFELKQLMLDCKWFEISISG